MIKKTITITIYEDTNELDDSSTPAVASIIGAIKSHINGLLESSESELIDADIQIGKNLFLEDSVYVSEHNISVSIIE
jgi:hypothetical protein